MIFFKENEEKELLDSFPVKNVLQKPNMNTVNEVKLCGVHTC